MDTGKIEMTCVVDAAVGMKLPVVALEDWLNEHISLSDYGSGVGKIFFVFIAVNPKNTIHESQIIFKEAERHLEIALKLNYQQVLDREGEPLMILLQALFLEAIDLCDQVHIANFSWRKFSKDLKKLFSKNNPRPKK